MNNNSQHNEARESMQKTVDIIGNLRLSSRNRESYDENLELEAELRRAYNAEELQAQLFEREAERYIENVRRQHAEKLTRLKQQAALDNDLYQRSECHKRAEDYGRELTGQIKLKEAERNMMMVEARTEREILAEVEMTRERRERTRTLEARNELAEGARRERLMLEEMKLTRSEEGAEAVARKEQEDEDYLAEIDERAVKLRSVREEGLKMRERTVRETAEMLLNNESEKRERRTLLVELLAEDVRLELLARDEEERIRRTRAREELAASLEEQIGFNERCKLRAVEQDRAFGEEIMRQIMEDERTTRLTAAARRRMQLQYREDLGRLIEARRAIRDEEMRNMQQAEGEENRRERIRMERVAREQGTFVAGAWGECRWFH